MTVYDELRSLLRRVERRWRGEAALYALGRGACLAAVPLLIATGVSRWAPMSDLALATLVATAVVCAVGLLIWSAWGTTRRPSLARLARFVEERLTARADIAPLDDVMVSAVDTLTEPASKPFGALVVGAAVRRLEAIGTAEVVTPRALWRAAGAAAGGTVALLLAGALGWPTWIRACEAAWIALAPHSISVDVLPGDVRIPTGQPLTITARISTSGRTLDRLTPELMVDDGAESRAVSMARDGDRFTFAFESIDRTFRYRVLAGKKRSADYTVTALVPPKVTRIDLRYEYPAFSGLAAREERNGGDIYGPAGTKVRVQIHTDKPVAGGQLAFSSDDHGRPGSLRRTSDRLLEADLVVARDDSYRIGLLDADGLRSSGDTEYFLRVMDDRPPEVRILRPAADQQITPLEEVPIEARAEDDHGISRFELVYAVAGRAPKVVPLASGGASALTRAGTYTIAAEDLGVQPGDVVTYYARARDVGRGKRPTETRSDMFFLEVRPFSEEFVLAQSQALSGAASDQLETLVAAQKEIINATWGIERRAAAGAGRSAADISAIAAAQAELKGRVERLSPSQNRGRGAFRFPQQSTPPRQLRGAPRTDPVGTAIAAMTRAIDELGGQRTSEALPHEMAALQGLLRAQAEVRRREVAQQAGAAMGGMGRQGQDLSALFDKELQRQQRTNYENRSPSSNSRPDRDEEHSLLDRIRSLAERQEELSRRQRDLATARQAESDEVKRQLEVLRREQEALRQQLEELSRQVEQSASSGGQSGASGQSRSVNDAMRQATNEMRNATGELQRQSPASAADRAERAAQGLRQAEQEMRERSGDARDRAAGNARLEAQQIAGDQRRIAAEAARLAKGGEAETGDARRRLSAEQEQLADRVDALQRSLENLARTPRPPSGNGREGSAADAAADVARELSRERIAERMRANARGRSGEQASGQRSAEADAAQAGPEQQIARTLDRLAERLGADSRSAADLSSELDRSRSIRDRLDRLDRDLKAAEAKASAARQPQAPRGRTSGANPGNDAGGQTGAAAESSRLREEYGRELQSARETLERLQQGSTGGAHGGATPEQHEWSPVDKGTEAFKQDYSSWESLRRDIDSALDRYEASVIARAARKSLHDRLSTGGSEGVPDEYRRLIARYYESLARRK